MKIIELEIPGTFVVEPDIYRDQRGFFMETFNQENFAAHRLPAKFVQDSFSFSTKGVIRGLHFQFPASQGKLVFALKGEIFDVVVDITRGSPTFGRWVGVLLSETNHRQVCIPAGCAHGFCVTSETALVAYKFTRRYEKEAQKGIRWDDPDLRIAWPVEKPLLSEKDAQLPFLRDIDKKALHKK